MPASLSVRLDTEVFDKVRAKGGSPWVRDLILAVLSVDPEPELELGDPDLELYRAEQQARLEAEMIDSPLVPVPEPSPTAVMSEDFCPRWMHHKANEHCLVCGAAA